MQKKVNIAEPINDSVLIPNVSLGQFVFGSNIKQYLNNTSYLFEENPDKVKGYGFESQLFLNNNLCIFAVEKGKVFGVFKVL